MGRSIYCGEDFLWKYVLGEQVSEMYRINSELGIGEYSFTEDGDTLIIRQTDLEGLDRALTGLKPTQPQNPNYFLDRIAGDYIPAHPDQAEFVEFQ